MTTTEPRPAETPVDVVRHALARLDRSRSEAERGLALNALRRACRGLIEPARKHNPMITHAAKRGEVVVTVDQRSTLATLLRWNPSRPKDGARVRWSNGGERTVPLSAVKAYTPTAHGSVAQ